jgi:hypothetical protein
LVPRSDLFATLEVDEADAEADADEGGPFVCSSCGRTDLPEAGGWEPPICLECDAAINFDAEEAFDLGF